MLRNGSAQSASKIDQSLEIPNGTFAGGIAAGNAEPGHENCWVLKSDAVEFE